MAVINAGDIVQVSVREQTSADIKSGLYYAHFGGMRGTILKLYGEEASVLVARDSLPAEVKSRHTESEKMMRQRWLDGLSEEARGRLTQREKDFALNYAILISLKDLVRADDPASSESSKAETAAEAAKRITASDLDAREAAFLEKRVNAGTKNS